MIKNKKTKDRLESKCEKNLKKIKNIKRERYENGKK